MRWRLKLGRDWRGPRKEPAINYYKHHIGDYDSHTAHLSWLEDAAYSRLMRLYYRNESAIPADLGKVCRLVRASSKAERDAVESVLNEFFTLAEDGWHNSRCDAEIDAAKAKAEKNREAGKTGGRPKKKETMMVSENNHDGFCEETEMVCENNPSHKPLANSQEKEKAARVPALTVADLAADGLSENLAVEFLAHRKRKRALLTARAWTTIKSEAGKAGLSPAAVAERCIARGWVGFEAEWTKPSPNGAASPPIPRTKSLEEVGL